MEIHKRPPYWKSRSKLSIFTENKIYIRPAAYDPPSDSSTEEEEDNLEERVEVA